MQEEVASEILRLLRAEPAKIFVVMALCPLSDLDKALLETHVKMSHMPKECLQALLTEVQPGKHDSADVCEKLERGAMGALHSLLHMALACQPSTKWPRLAHERRIFRAMAV